MVSGVHRARGTRCRRGEPCCPCPQGSDIDSGVSSNCSYFLILFFNGFLFSLLSFPAPVFSILWLKPLCTSATSAPEGGLPGVRLALPLPLLGLSVLFFLAWCLLCCSCFYPVSWSSARARRDPQCSSLLPGHGSSSLTSGSRYFHSRFYCDDAFNDT